VSNSYSDGHYGLGQLPVAPSRPIPTQAEREAANKQREIGKSAVIQKYFRGDAKAYDYALDGHNLKRCITYGDFILDGKVVREAVFNTEKLREWAVEIVATADLVRRQL